MRPFLTVVTRASQRPFALARCIQSVSSQTCTDVEHLFLVDHEHRGLKFANEQFQRHRELPRGEYVWALDDDDIVNDAEFVAKVKEVASTHDPDVILVRTHHGHTGQIHPQPEIWSLDWSGGERPAHWVGGGSCVVVRRAVWARHLAEYHKGQDDEWATGGDWHFITSLIEADLKFVKCDVLAGSQSDRGYGKQVEDCGPDWFDNLARKFAMEKLGETAYRLDYRQLDQRFPMLCLPEDERCLKILQAAQWDWAGCAYQLARAINKHTVHTARAIRWKEEGNFGFPTDVVAPDDDAYRELWEWADVVHVHDSVPNPRGFPERPVVATMHGSKYRRSPEKHQRILKDRGWMLTVATPDLTVIHDAPWMPDTRVDLPEPSHTEPGFTVLHCPSIRANKGTEHVLAAVEALGDVRLVLVEDAAWEECLRTKGRFERAVLVDQFAWGYGCNAIEAWAYGIPVISNAVGRAKEALDREFGYMPFLQATPETLVDAIRRMRNPIAYERIRDIGVGHYQRYHAPKSVAMTALRLYRSAMTYQLAETAAPTGGLGNQGLVLLRYTGRNYGRMTFNGPTTQQRYEFSAANRYKYVDARDASKMLNMERHTKRLFELAEEGDA